MGRRCPGWNLAGLLSILLGFAAASPWRAATPPASAALAVALLANAFPYRWITLLDGSPTGFAMGLRRGSSWGWTWPCATAAPREAGWPGLALLGAYAADLHVFYFGALAAPAGACSPGAPCPARRARR